MTLGNTPAFEGENANSYDILNVAPTVCHSRHSVLAVVQRCVPSQRLSTHLLSAVPLCLSLQASQEDIQRAYKQLAFRFHPDRLKTGDSSIFARITTAYELLQNPVSRALYDMDCGLVAASPAQLGHVHRLRRVQAVQALRLMFNKVQQVTAREQESNGLIIVQARYGELSPASRRLLDVTMQLQAAVADSLLILRGGGSKSWLEGWYDPTEGGDNELDIVYSLRGEMHRVRVGDEEPLQLPQPEHRMSSKERAAWEREFRLRSVDLHEVARKRNRRYAAYATVATVAIGTAVYCHHRSQQHRARSSTSSNAASSSFSSPFSSSAVKGILASSDSWVRGVGGVIGSGSEQLRDIMSDWLRLLCQWSERWMQQLPQALAGGAVRLVAAGQTLVSTVSPQWLGQHVGVKAMLV